MCGELYLCKEGILYRMYFLSKWKSDSWKSWKHESNLGLHLFSILNDGSISAEIHIMDDRCHREG